ncbi:MAG TPA: helix-turn-helix domain-containing protein [Solirubrobacterales bacterium]|nr:helix-turn-helix domain-containing protein [Solirubrobacterales bacterium]
MEEAIFARVRPVANPTGETTIEYVHGLRAAVAAALEYGLESIERGENRSLQVPPAVSAQTRRAVRNGVSLETVLRRYRAGNRLLREFVIDSANQRPGQALRQILRTESLQFDRFVALVASEYMREQAQATRSPAQRLTDRVQQMLSGIDSDHARDLAYELDAWHLGLVATGAGAKDVIRALAAALDRQALIVPQDTGVIWAWLGGRRELAVVDLERILLATGSKDVCLAIGEPRRGMEGWRLTHYEAEAGLQVMQRRPQMLTRGSDALLLAGLLDDDALAECLLKTYLEPLDRVGDADGALRKTLRAYFDANCNTAAAAAALAVNRHTVRRRLQKTEEALGRLVHVCHAELEVALRLEELQPPPARDDFER